LISNGRVKDKENNKKQPKEKKRKKDYLMAHKNSQYMYLFFQRKIEHNLNVKIVVQMINYGLASAVTSPCVNLRLRIHISSIEP